MMGTSLLSMPWAIEQAGLVAGLSLILVMAAICFYTAFCILQVYGIYGILLSVRVFSFNDDVLQLHFYHQERRRI
jgi:amino acid permease